jgi:hypothetical protein
VHLPSLPVLCVAQRWQSSSKSSPNRSTNHSSPSSSLYFLCPISDAFTFPVLA